MIRPTIGVLAVSIAGLTGAVLAPAAHAAAPDKVRVIVAHKAGAKSSVVNAVNSAKGDVVGDVFGADAIVVNLPQVALNGISRNPNVDYVEEDVKRYPSSIGYTPSTGTPYTLGQKVPYGIPMVQADQVSDANASNRKVCIIDSGYDNSHEDLAGNNVTGEYDSGTGWWYTDENHHGTHVAGTIAGINNGTGVVGVNPNKKLKLHIVKVFNAAGWAYSSSLVTAANKCASAGANVISMSLGGSRRSATEDKAFSSLLSKNNILSIAAAGNDGTTAISYPAGYTSVMSVGALDENKAWATFSQYNSAVEISAPGVNVLSSVPMGQGASSALSVASTSYEAGGMDGSPLGTVTAPLYDFGLGSATNSAASGKICLIQRGTNTFSEKVLNCQNSGGVGAIVYNNAAGSFGGTVSGGGTTIPSVTTSDTVGATLKGMIGQNATIAVTATNHSFYDGTSMATPHVSGVAALVWSYAPTCTATQLRTALTATAQDLGPAGRDTKFGYGLVQALSAKNKLANGRCGG